MLLPLIQHSSTHPYPITWILTHPTTQIAKPVWYQGAASSRVESLFKAGFHVRGSHGFLLKLVAHLTEYMALHMWRSPCLSLVCWRSVFSMNLARGQNVTSRIVSSSGLFAFVSLQCQNWHVDKNVFSHLFGAIVTSFNSLPSELCLCVKPQKPKLWYCVVKLPLEISATPCGKEHSSINCSVSVSVPS